MKKKIEYVMGACMLFVFMISAIGFNISASEKEKKDENNDKNIEYSRITIAIDPGHGGMDPGKVGINKELEKDINLSISLKLRRIFTEKGINVVMTRTEDIGLYQSTDNNKKRTDMKNRTNLINDSKADICISIHQNSFTSKNVSGAQTFYYSKSEQGKKLATYVQKELITSVDPSNTKTIKANDNYYMLLHLKCPAVIVECGFLSNWQDATNLKDDIYQEKIANAIYKAVIEYLSNI